MVSRGAGCSNVFILTYGFKHQGSPLLRQIYFRKLSGDSKSVHIFLPHGRSRVCNDRKFLFYRLHHCWQSVTYDVLWLHRYSQYSYILHSFRDSLSVVIGAISFLSVYPTWMLMRLMHSEQNWLEHKNMPLFSFLFLHSQHLSHMTAWKQAKGQNRGCIDMNQSSSTVAHFLDFKVTSTYSFLPNFQ